MKRHLLAGAALAAVIVAVIIGAVVSDTDVGGSLGFQLARVSGGRLGGVDEQLAHDTAGSLPDSVCISCHGTMRTSKTEWHNMHFEKTFTHFTCKFCHKKITKGERSVNGKILIDRKVCPRCHLKKFVAFTKDHRKPDWIKRHKLLRRDKKNGVDIFPIEVLAKKYPECFICHRRKELSFCKECHAFHPHNYEWINGLHGRTAVAKDFMCLRCHEKTTWCTTECHEGVTLPHNIPKRSKHWKDNPGAPRWRKIHYEEASRLSGTPLFTGPEGDRLNPNTFKKCRRCHDSPRSLGKHPDFCMQCHHDRFYRKYPDQLGVPWWKNAMPFVKKNGSDQCWKCHMPEFCVACHTTGVKAQPGTTFVGWSEDNTITTR